MVVYTLDYANAESRDVEGVVITETVLEHTTFIHKIRPRTLTPVCHTPDGVNNIFREFGGNDNISVFARKLI